MNDLKFCIIATVAAIGVFMILGILFALNVSAHHWQQIVRE